MSNFRPEGSQNSADNVFAGLSVGPEENRLAGQYLAAHDLAPNTCRAIRNDLRKFAGWFSHANREPFAVRRVTVRDVTDFKDHLRREQGQAVSTVNRALVTIRRYLAWLGENGHLKANPAKPVKELRRQQLAPKGLERDEVRQSAPGSRVAGGRSGRGSLLLILIYGLPGERPRRPGTARPDVVRPERHGSVPVRQGQQAAVGAIAASGSAGASSLS